jgi:hypothetical protein
MSNSNEIMTYSGAVQAFKRTGGIIDGAAVAKFRRRQREQREENNKTDSPHQSP